MTFDKARIIVLASRPEGAPTADNFRLEERELFQKLQESATDEQLSELAAREYEEQREMPWEDEFWK